MARKANDNELAISVLLDEYFRLRQAIDRLHNSSLLPYLVKTRAAKAPTRDDESKKLLAQGTARLRAGVRELLIQSKINKREHVRCI